MTTTDELKQDHHVHSTVSDGVSTLEESLAGAAAHTGTAVEITERWRCPPLRTARAFRRAGA